MYNYNDVYIIKKQINTYLLSISRHITNSYHITFYVICNLNKKYQIYVACNYIVRLRH